MTLAEKIIAYPVDCYTRVTGWFVPKKAMNPGKQSEFDARVYYKIKEEDSK